MGKDIPTTGTIRLEINVDRETGLKRKLTSIRKKAAAVDSSFKAEIIGSVHREVRIPVYNEFLIWLWDRVEMREYLVVEITGDTQVGISGWSVGAILTHVGEATLVNRCQRYVGDDDQGESVYEHILSQNELKSSYEPICEHCNKNRVRGITLILSNNDTGELKQVGKSCLKKFHATDAVSHLESCAVLDLSHLADNADVGEDPEEPRRSYGFSRQEVSPSIQEFLAHCARAIREHGYVSKSASYASEQAARCRSKCGPEAVVLTSTVDRALSSLNALRDPKRAAAHLPTTEDRSKIEAPLAWIRNLDKPASDYIYNLKVACTLDHVMKRTAGFAASLFKAHERFLADEQVRQAKEDARAKADGELVEITEGRRELVATVLSTRWEDGQWGETHKMLVLTEDGQKLWGSVPSSIDGDIKGERIKFTATVSKSDRDPKFGFFKRPTKAELIDNADKDPETLLAGVKCPKCGDQLVLSKGLIAQTRKLFYTVGCFECEVWSGRLETMETAIKDFMEVS